jgi:hypothetical protein
MAAKLYDLARMTVASAPGSGTITLGSAARGPDGTLFLTFAQAGVSDGDVVSYAINDPASPGASEVGHGTYTASGTTLARTTVLKSTNSNAAINCSAQAQVAITALAEDIVTSVFARSGPAITATAGDYTYAANTIALPRSYLAGLTLSNDGGTPNTILDISAGSCRDGTDATNIVLAAFTKSTGGAWAAGSGSNGMGAGLTIAVSTWYHVFAIINAGSADVYFDTDAGAANKPASTTAFRRIGSFKTDASAHILAFSQFGEEFLWGAVIQETSAATVPTSATLLSLGGIPSGVKVRARLRIIVLNASVQHVLVQSPDETSAIANATLGNADVTAPSASGNFGNLIVRTNTSAQVRWSTTGSGMTAYTVSYGWFDDRGRNA